MRASSSAAEQEIGKLLVGVGVGGPVEIHGRGPDPVRHPGSCRAHEAGKLGGGLAAVAQEQEEGPELHRLDRTVEHHAHRCFGLVLVQRARERGPPADSAQHLGEGVTGRGRA